MGIPSCLPQKRAQQPLTPQQFSAHVLWLDQDATWYGGRLRSSPHRVRWGLSSSAVQNLSTCITTGRLQAVSTRLKTWFIWLGAGHLLQQVDILWHSCSAFYGQGRAVSTWPRSYIRQNWQQLSLCDHTAAICRSDFYQLRQIRPAIQSLTFDAVKTIVQAFIECRPD